MKQKGYIEWDEFKNQLGFTEYDWEDINKDVDKMIKEMNLAKKRKNKKMTQVELAAKANLPRSTITRLERSVNVNPTLGNLKKIAKALDMKMEICFTPIDDGNR